MGYVEYYTNDRVHRILEGVRRILIIWGGGVGRIFDGVCRILGGCPLTCTPHNQPLQEDEDGTSPPQRSRRRRG